MNLNEIDIDLEIKRTASDRADMDDTLKIKVESECEKLDWEYL